MVRSSGSGSRRERREGVNNGRYKGVRMRKWGKWVAEVRQPNSRDRIWLGSYETAEEAARAYDAAVFCLRGPSALINFPSDPPDIPVEAHHEMSPTQIQVAAARHARGLSRDSSSSAQEFGSSSRTNFMPLSVVDQATVASPSRGELEDSGSLFGDYSSIGTRSKECYFPVEERDGGDRGGGGGGGGGHDDEEEDGISSGSVLFDTQRLWTF